ncbi:unnamed protein product, partial [Rotaria sp. Silwood1]
MDAYGLQSWFPT